MRSDQSPSAVETLRRLGFNELEALVYCELVRVPASTGYAIAKAINRPHANVYQALNALEVKGAVLLEQGAKKTYSPVPSEELLSHLKSRFDQECALAENALKELEIGAPSNHAFYKLASRDQLFARARGLLAEAQETVIYYAFPRIAEELKDDVVATLDRGVKVAGMMMRQEDLIEGSGLVQSQIAERVLRVWPADPLIMVIDGRNSLLATLHRDTGEVLHALWMNSDFASLFFHNALVSDIILHQHKLMKDLQSGSEFVFGGFAPSYKELIARPRKD